MEFINDNLKSIYHEMYTSLDGTPDEKYDKIEDHCSSDPDLWNLDIPENEYGDITDAYHNALHKYLRETFEDYN